MQVNMLGQLQIIGEAEVNLRGPKMRVLGGMLVANANHMVSVGRLTEALWGEGLPRTAETNLRVYVYHLRNELGDKSRIRWDGAGYRMIVEDGELDVDSFESLSVEGRRAMTTGYSERALRQFRQALSLWRGPALLGLEHVGLLRPTAVRLEERRLSVLEWRLLTELLVGASPETLADLAALVAEHPLRERFRAMLMIALRQADRVPEALGVYHEGRRLLDAELGIAPGESVQRLHVSLLNGDRGESYLKKMATDDVVVQPR